MTTLLLVFVCLRVITAAVSVELSGTCPGVWESRTEQCAALWSHHQVRAAARNKRTQDLLCVHTGLLYLDGCYAIASHCSCAWGAREIASGKSRFMGKLSEFQHSLF